MRLRASQSWPPYELPKVCHKMCHVLDHDISNISKNREISVQMPVRTAHISYISRERLIAGCIIDKIVGIKFDASIVSI
jgi:hypothetical protein